MRITIDINDAEITAIAGQKGGIFVFQELQRSPIWFLDTAKRIEITGQFGVVSLERGEDDARASAGKKGIRSLADTGGDPEWSKSKLEHSRPYGDTPDFNQQTAVGNADAWQTGKSASWLLGGLYKA